MYDSTTTPNTTSSSQDQLNDYESEAFFAAAEAYFSEPQASQPPYTNRGVRTSPHHETEATSTKENPDNSGDYAVCDFDWYQATIPADPEEIEASFIERFGGEFEPCHPINGYKEASTHSLLKFTIYWGGHNPHPNVKSTSHHSRKIAQWVRSAFPDHKVSRADVAFDFSYKGSFDDLVGRLQPIARQRGVNCTFQGDPAENDPAFDLPDPETGKKKERKGRTWYFGSSKSDMAITLYEKGFEQRGRGVEDIDPHWTRLEVRVRPQKSRKVQAASLSPFELVGFSKWISKAVGTILEETPTILPNFDKKDKPPMLVALEHMATQYSGHIRGFLEGKDRGGDPRSWQDLNRFLYMTIYSQKERQKMEARDAPAEQADIAAIAADYSFDDPIY